MRTSGSLLIFLSLLAVSVLPRIIGFRTITSLPTCERQRKTPASPATLGPEHWSQQGPPLRVAHRAQSRTGTTSAPWPPLLAVNDAVLTPPCPEPVKTKQRQPCSLALALSNADGDCGSKLRKI